MSDVLSPEALRRRRFQDGPVTVLRDTITRTVHGFVAGHADEPGMVQELLACLADACGVPLYGLRDVSNAREIFQVMVTQAIARRAMLPVPLATLRGEAANDAARTEIAGVERAAAQLDVVRMQPAVDLYVAALADATERFMRTQGDVPTMWIAVLTCLGKEVADVLHELRRTPGARAVFDQIVTDLLEPDLELDRERAG